MIQNILIYYVALITFFILGWFYSFRVKIFAWVDFLWAFSFIILSFFYIALNNDIPTQKTILISMYILWASRLSLHLFYRIKNKGEDKRYLVLIKKWKVWYGLKFLIIFLMQAHLALVLSIPIFLELNQNISILQKFSIILFILSLILELVADKQLKNFKKNNNFNQVCDKGLWKFSRHPNYFFETLIWFSFSLFVVESQYGYLGLIPFLVIYFLITKVTGIPPAEESSLKSKKDAYKDYQRRVNKFFLWFPKTIFVFFLLFSIKGEIIMAKDLENTNLQAQKIETVFNQLNINNMAILEGFYDKSVIFIDPIGKHTGLIEVTNYYKNLYQNVESIRFEFIDQISSSNTHAVTWIMYLNAPGLNKGKEVTLHGTSVIKFNEENKVIYHRDYFDMGEFIYEGVPLLGTIINFIKNKLKAK